MAGYKRFEELPVWQNSRVLAKEIDETINSTPIARNFKMRDQMSGSSGSIMDNIAEGFERAGNKEFILFLFFHMQKVPQEN
jgi:four helix bundle protein